MGEYRTRRIVYLVCFVSIFQPFTSAFSEEDQYRLSLKGLKGINVTISLSDEIKDINLKGLTEFIRNDAEVRLRMAGINVVSGNEVYKIPGTPQLNISVSGYRVETIPTKQEVGLAFAIRVELLQSTNLRREPSITVLANTWDYMVIGWCQRDKINAIRDGVKTSVDFFINAYLSVNPKGGK